MQLCTVDSCPTIVLCPAFPAGFWEWGGSWAEGAHQGSFQACGIVVAPTHDQQRPLCVELQGQVMDLLVQ